MSLKISELPVAANMANADVVCGLVGLADNQITREILLNAGTFEQITLSGNLSFLLQDTDGNAVLEIGVDRLFSVGNAIATEMVMSIAIGTTFSPAAGVFNILGGNACSMTFDALGSIRITDTSGVTPFITFVALFPGAWVIPPVTVDDAIQRLALAVFGLLGAPIP